MKNLIKLLTLLFISITLNSCMMDYSLYNYDPHIYRSPNYFYYGYPYYYGHPYHYDYHIHVNPRGHYGPRHK